MIAPATTTLERTVIMTFNYDCEFCSHDNGCSPHEGDCSPCNHSFYKTYDHSHSPYYEDCGHLS